MAKYLIASCLHGVIIFMVVKKLLCDEYIYVDAAHCQSAVYFTDMSK